ncbi:putative toxin-antitoxin system toxin component, PIN family [Candidatus Bathyarchaeota archaeon CG07_land_8_20_14_0_80_47_9]|jgi:putative PIN family toxin of toxin-antitoxin system|nr:MAG: putative toxin-antitoxin system toxin component, PIN family [Candidatus Bathyarchaeota archaeon CG07_land_8_20_14_0_80_47_9]
MNVVLDTNVLVSALIKTGKPRELFLKITEGRIQLILSRSILKEFSEVADDPRIRKYVDQDDIIAFLRIVGSVAKIVKVKSRFKVVKEDPDDDAVLRTAFDGKADCIVSGNNHLLSLGAFRGIRILTVDELLTSLKKEKAQK